MSSARAKRKIDTIERDVKILESYAQERPRLPHGYGLTLTSLSQRLLDIQGLMLYDRECPPLHRDAWTLILPYLGVRDFKALRLCSRQLRGMASPHIRAVKADRHTFKIAKTGSRVAQWTERCEEFVSRVLTTFPNLTYIKYEDRMFSLLDTPTLQHFFNNIPKNARLVTWVDGSMPNQKVKIRINIPLATVILHEMHANVWYNLYAIKFKKV